MIPDFRCAKCLRGIAPGHVFVPVEHSPELQRARYQNLLVCYNDKLCPHCSRRINERRRATLEEMIRRAAALGYDVIMLTYTLRHKDGEACIKVTNALRHAYRALWSGEASKRRRKRYGILGAVRGFETTTGRHGWHPHFHVLVFVPRGFTGATKFCEELRAAWLKRLKRQGASAEHRIGVNVVKGIKTGEAYLTKVARDWSLAAEMARADIKQGKLKGRTFFQVAIDFGLYGYVSDRRLMREFAEAMRQLRMPTLDPTPGLLKVLGMPEDSLSVRAEDKFALDEEAATWTVLAILTREQWKTIREANAYAEVLSAADDGDKSKLLRKLSEVLGQELTTLDLDALLDQPPARAEQVTPAPATTEQFKALVETTW